MASMLKNVSMDGYQPDPTYVLKRVTPKYVYEDGNRTEKLEGYSYRVVNCSSYDTFTITVNHKKPVISQEALQEAAEDGKTVIVEVTGATVTPYLSTRTQSIEDSIKATDIRLVTTE